MGNTLLKKRLIPLVDALIHKGFQQGRLIEKFELTKKLIQENCGNPFIIKMMDLSEEAVISIRANLNE